MKSYKLGNLKELINFDADCNKAACECPQFISHSNELAIRRKELSAEDIYDTWKNEEVLWRYGYSDCLSPRAKATFNYVYNNGRNGLRELCTK